MTTAEREILFRINAALSSQFSNAMKAAQNQLNAMNRRQMLNNAGLSQATRTLAAYQGQLTKTRENIQQFKRLNGAIQQNSAALVQARSRSAQLRQAYKDEYNQTERMRQSYNRLKQVYRENRGTMSADQRSAMQEQIQAAAQELKEQRKRESNALKASTGGDKNVTNLESKLARQRQQLSELRSSLSQAGVNVSQLAAAEQKLQQEIERTNAALEHQAQIAAARQRLNDAQTNFSYASDNFQNAMSTAGSIMSPFKSAVKTAMDFEHVMSEVKSLTQMDNIKTGNFERVEAEMKSLTAQAKELGASTVYTAKEVGEAQAYIARTGWDTNAILESTPKFLKLAAAGNMDIARTADIATNIMTAFGHDVTQVGHDTDVLAYTFTHSNQDLEQLGQTLKYAAPVAKMFGSSLEETAALTKFMADAGIQGSMAGTSLRQTMLRLVAPPKKATKAMEENGIAVADCMKEWQNANEMAAQYGVTMQEGLSPGKQMLSIIKQLDKNMAGMSDHEKMAAFNAITGINAVSGAMNIFGAGSEKIEEFTKLLENCDGALEQTYGVMTDDTFGAAKGLESAFEAMSTSIGEALLPTVRRGMEALTGLFQGLNSFAVNNPEIIQSLAAVAAAISAIIVGLAGYGVASAGVEVLAASFAALKAGALESAAAQRISQAASLSWGGIFSSITAKAAAARTAVSAFFAQAAATNGMSIINSLQGIGTAFLNVGRSAMAFAISPIGVALMALGLAGYYCYTHWSQVAPVFEMLADVIGGSLATAIQTLSPAFSSMSESASRMGPAFAAVGKIIFQVFAVGANVVIRFAALLITSLGNAIKTVMDLFSGLGGALASFLAGDFSKAGEILSSTISKTVDNVGKTFSDGFAGMSDIAKNWDAPLTIMAHQEAIDNRRTQETETRNSDIAKSLSTAIESFKQQNSDKDVSKISEAVNAAVTKIKQDPKADAAPLLKEVSTAIESFKEKNSDADVSKISEAVSASLKEIQSAQKEQNQGAEMVKAVSTAIESLKKENSDADFSKIEAAISAAVEKSDSPKALAEAVSTAIESSRKENPELDLSKISEAIAATQKQQTGGEEVLKAVSTAIESLKQQNSDADYSKISEAISAAVEKSSSKEELSAALSTAIESAKQEQPELDLTPITEAIASAQQAQSEQKSIETAESQSNINQLGEAATQTGQQLAETQGNISQFDAALPQPIDNLNNLGSTSGSTAGSLQAMADAAGQVASALSAKASEISSIKISAPQVSAAQNAMGGIYSKGAFLTTFAEKSPEAAIPIDNSQRAIDLWTKTGQMLGTLPGNNFATRQPPQAQQMSILERLQRRRAEQVRAQYEAAKKAQADSIAIESDSLGNLKGYNGPDYNLIQEGDLSPIREAKLQKQRELMAQAQSKKLPHIPDSTAIESRQMPRSIFSGRVDLPKIPEGAMGHPYVNLPHSTPIESSGGGLLSAINDRISATSSGGIFSRLENILPKSESASPIDLKFEINIAGNASAEDVENGIKRSIPLLEETFEQKLANHQHELQRRAF